MIDDAAAFSKIGTRPANEDSYALWHAGGTLFAAIADGLGGMGGGGHASSYVVEFMRAHTVRPDTSAAELGALVRACHRGLQALQRQCPEDRSMTTTLVVMGMRAGELVAAHCGDSRLYLLGAAGVEQLTEDHSEAQRLFREGRLSRTGLANYPRKYILESAIGVPGEPMVQEIRHGVDAGDWLVLATDGAYAMLEPEDLSDLARHRSTAAQFAAACLARIEARDPHDNYTMVVARAARGRLRRALRHVFPWSRMGGHRGHRV